MIYIFTDEPSNGKAKVTTQLFNTEGVPEETLAKAVIVESIPVVEAITGKDATLFYDFNENKLYYEYYDRQLTPDEKIAQLEEQLKITQDALDALLLG